LQESLENTLRDLKNTRTIYHQKLSFYEKDLAITASTNERFSLIQLIKECKNKIQEIKEQIKDVEQQIKDIDARQTTSVINEDKLPDRRDIQNGKPYLWKEDLFAEVDTNIIWVKYIPRNSLDLTNLVLGPIDLEIKINYELCRTERVQVLWKYGFLYPFTCKSSGKNRTANIIVHIKLFRVNSFLKVDGKEYKFHRASYKL
jgi:hypothetical protein